MEKGKMKFKKPIIVGSSAVLAIVMVFCVLAQSTGIFSATTNSKKNFKELESTQSYNAVFNTTINDDEKNLDVDFTVDYDYMINGDNTKYKRDLSKMSILLATDVYATSSIKLTSGISDGFYDDNSVEDSKSIYKALGFEDINQFVTAECNLNDDWNYDTDDRTEFVCGHKYIKANNKNYAISVVSIRGTNGTTEEWSSNFDVGADTDTYYKRTGEHPMWRNKENHKGFDVAANKVIDLLNKYCLNEYNDDTQKIILLTGHSRGASIANLVGKYFEDKDDYKSFTYTFATPNATTATDASSYKTIFNILNSDDIVPCLPLEGWGFATYGTTKAISVEKEYESWRVFSHKKGTWEWFTDSTDYNNDGDVQDVLDKMSVLADNREALYELDMTDDGYTDKESYSYPSKEKAEKFKETLAQKLENEKLLKFCKLSVEKVDKEYVVRVRYCPAYLMQVLSNLTTGLLPEDEIIAKYLGRDVEGKYETAKTAFIESSGQIPGLGKLNYGGMEDPHTMATYYLIANNDFKSLKNLPY